MKYKYPLDCKIFLIPSQHKIPPGMKQNKKKKKKKKNQGAAQLSK